MKEQTLTRGNILHSFLKFAVPVLLALFLQAMYGAADHRCDRLCDQHWRRPSACRRLRDGSGRRRRCHRGGAGGERSRLLPFDPQKGPALLLLQAIPAAAGRPCQTDKVCIFLMLVSSAYMQSVSAFVAQNNGAGLTQRSSKALLCSIATALIAGIAMSLLALFGGALLSSVFSNEQAVITAAHSYLKAYAIDCLLTSVLFCFIGYFNGCKHTIFVMIQGVAGAFFVRIPVVYLMSRMDEATLFLIGLGTPVSSAVQIILCLAALLYFRKKEKNKEERLA